MAAEQCVSLTDKRVIVIPTKSIPQGVSALFALDSAENVEDLAVCMTEAAARIHTALITTASRDSAFDGLDIKEGEHLALLEDAIAACGPVADDVFEAIAATLGSFSPEFITIFTGEGAEEAETENIMNRIASASPGAEITVINGGQPVYQYIIAVE